MEFRTLSEQAAAVAAGNISPVELVERALAAIDRVQAATNAFTHVFAGDAIRRARELTKQSGTTGPLHGVPVAVKELYDVAGAPTTGCCVAYADRVARSDSAVVERLRAAGAIIVAKTNQHELAIGGTSLESSFGPVANPWDSNRVPGGSSGGSGVAVATGAVSLAMSSDTAGSIRHPSSFCGVTGLKTTLGAVSRRGTMPLAPSLDTMGPIAATAADCALAYSVIAGFDHADPLSLRVEDEVEEPLKGKRIGLPAEFFDKIAADTRSGVESAATELEAIGAHVEPMHVPDLESIRLALGAIFVSEFADQYRDLWNDDRMGERVGQLLDLGRAWTAPDLAAAHLAAARFRRALDEVFGTYDMLLAPSTPHAAQPVDAIEVAVEGGTIPHTDVEFSRLAMPVNLAGVPALAFPVGFTTEGMPLGAQLIGPKRSALTLCAAGREYQETTDWHRRRPPGF